MHAKLSITYYRGQLTSQPTSHYPLFLIKLVWRIWNSWLCLSSSPISPSPISPLLFVFLSLSLTTAIPSTFHDIERANVRSTIADYKLPLETLTLHPGGFTLTKPMRELAWLVRLIEHSPYRSRNTNYDLLYRCPDSTVTKEKSPLGLWVSDKSDMFVKKRDFRKSFVIVKKFNQSRMFVLFVQFFKITKNMKILIASDLLVLSLIGFVYFILQICVGVQRNSIKRNLTRFKLIYCY